VYSTKWIGGRWQIRMQSLVYRGVRHRAIWAASRPEPEKTAGMSLQLIAISKSRPTDGSHVEGTFNTS
jgi:hypothetical protein